MNFRDFDNMRLAIKVNGFTPEQLILLYGEVVARLIDFQQFEPMKQELSDTEELLTETLDRFEEAKPYQPDPADADGPTLLGASRTA